MRAMADTELQEATPLGGLPATQRVLLKSAQIDVALVEIRYSTEESVISASQGLDIQRILVQNGVAFPRIQSAQKQQIALSMDAAGASSQVEIQGRGWQLLSGDGTTVVTVLPDSMSIQIGNYERWSVSILPVLTALILAVETVLQPELLYRIGTRFVNRLTDKNAQKPQAWIGRIKPSLLGVVNDENLGHLITSTQQQFELKLGDSEGALIRHGAFTDAAMRGATSYLVDTDVYTMESMKFESKSIAHWTRLLNITALSIFQQIVTLEYRNKMDPVVVDDDDKANTERSSGE
jgi:uncharacterized protein (TIGR04255 family)